MNEIAWQATLFLVHLIAFAGAIALYGRGPCWMQKLSVFGLIIAMGIASGAYGLAFASALFPDLGLWGSWQIFLIALLIEHIAVLLMIFRLVFKSVLWPKSSTRFRSSRA